MTLARSSSRSKPVATASILALTAGMITVISAGEVAASSHQPELGVHRLSAQPKIMAEQTTPNRHSRSSSRWPSQPVFPAIRAMVSASPPDKPWPARVPPRSPISSAWWRPAAPTSPSDSVISPGRSTGQLAFIQVCRRRRISLPNLAGPVRRHSRRHREPALPARIRQVISLTLRRRHSALVYRRGAHDQCRREPFLDMLVRISGVQGVDLAE